MTKRLAFAVLLAVVVAAPLRADFDSLVRAVGGIRGMHRIPLPGISLVRFAVWMVHPKGVHDVQLATFTRKGGDLEGAEFQALLREHAEAGYRPLVQAHSRSGRQLTLIWARPTSGDLVELLLVAHESRDQTVVLRTVVDLETMAREITHPRRATRVARR
ncbi:MAG: hypothetical protein AABO58_12755 [Acidobacteriota bacterium]